MDEKEIEEFKKIREQDIKESLKINITQNIMYKRVKNGFTIKIEDYTIQFDDKETITINDSKNNLPLKFEKNVNIKKHNSYLLNNNVDINTLNSEIKNLNHVLGNESKYTKFKYMGLYFRGVYTHDKFKNDNPDLEKFIDDNFENLKQFGYHGENAFNEQTKNFETVLTDFTATLTPPEPLILINGFINNTNQFDLSLKIKDFIEIFVKPPTTPEKKGGKRRSQKIKRKRRRTIKKRKKTKSKK